jgi:lysophospholipase L1-like esterase
MQRSLFVFLLLLSTVGPLPAAETFALRDGDRVVLLGGALIEREQRYGFWEAALSSRFPNRQVLYRNLGWSGDTVWAESRGVFDSPARGFARLIAGVKGLKPTLIVVAYGGNEAFDGEAGLPRFKQGLERLLDALAPTGARVVLVSPPGHENLGPPLPDPRSQNRNLELYRDAIREIAGKRGHAFLDLYTALAPDRRPKSEKWTDDGMHLTALGYRRAAGPVLEAAGMKPTPWSLEVNAGGKVLKAQGEKAEKQEGGLLRLLVTSETLPLPDEARRLMVHGLKPGRYTLQTDGKVVARATAAEWDRGVPLTTGPDQDQAEQMRRVIVEKNRLYFHRWRPQNETYLFGFRKHEQGQNAREIPLFDPLVEAREKEIARLRQPTAHRYELIPEGKGE